MPPALGFVTVVPAAAIPVPQRGNLPQPRASAALGKRSQVNPSPVKGVIRIGHVLEGKRVPDQYRKKGAANPIKYRAKPAVVGSE